ncbi:MAG: FtsX-like permease family protein [Bacteroidota bacterium]
MNSHSPPKWAHRFLHWFCKPKLLEHIEGDLLESFDHTIENQTTRKAKWKFCWEVLGLFRPGIVRNFHLTSIHPFSTAMIFNYLKVGIRQIRRHALFSFLNVIGLAVSMAVCLLLMMILIDQYSQDTFHENRDRIYRVVTGRGEGQAKQEEINKFLATGPIPIAAELEQTYVGVEATVKIKRLNDPKLITEDKNLSAKGFYVDQSFLQVFDFGEVQGALQEPLAAPNSLVLTQKTARKLYGNTDPIGKVLKVGNGEYSDLLITGVMEDPPIRTHMPFDFLVSFSTYETQNPDQISNWGDCWNQWIYVLLKDDKGSKAELASGLRKISIRQSEQDAYSSYRFEAQALAEINPSGTHMAGNEIQITTPSFVFTTLSILGIVIMLSACFNYTNLSIARSLKRAKEIGIRKVIGGKRGQLVAQFLVESILISLFALILAVILLEFLIPAFYSIDRRAPTLIHLQKTPQLYLWFVGFSILTGLIAGIFPALHLSSYRPIQVLKSLKRVKAFSFIGLRKGLIVIQFTFCLFFVLSAILLFKQYNLLVHSDHGFDYKNIIHVDLQNQSYELFSQEVSSLGGFEQVSGCSYVMASGNSNGVQIKIPNTPDVLGLHANHSSRNFFENMRMQFLAGGTFPENTSREIEKYIILNETAVKKLQLGSPIDAVGQGLELLAGGDSTRLVTVVGVVRDFYDMGTAQPVYPYCFRYDPSKILYANIRVSEPLSPLALNRLKKAWNEVDPIQALKYSYYDREVKERYGLMETMAKTVGTMSTMAIIIACLGLLGMVTYMVEGRVKEVGIRKILGASTKELIWTLSKSFMFLLGIAILIAVPLSIYLNKMWIETQEIQVDIGPQVILLGIGIVLFLSVIVVSSQTFTAAQGDPVKALRSD